MADGAAALQIALLTLDIDDDGDPAAATPVPWRAASAPTTLQRALDPFLHSAELCANAARDVARAVAHPRATAGDTLRDAGRLVHALAQDLLPRAPGSALNGELGPRRTLVQHRVALDGLRAASRGTLNDVGLTAIAGALRTLALEDGRPAEPLKAMVPVNMRRRHDAATLGNRVSMTSVWLPLELSSPAARLERVARADRELQAIVATARRADAVLPASGCYPACCVGRSCAPPSRAASTSRSPACPARRARSSCTAHGSTRSIP